MKHLHHVLILSFCTYSCLIAMNRKSNKSQMIWIRTSDDQIVQAEKKYVNQMRILQVLLAHQRGHNSEKNPLYLLMIEDRAQSLKTTKTTLSNLKIRFASTWSINSKEFLLLLETFARIEEKSSFYEYCQELKQRRKCHMLLHAANKIQATEIIARYWELLLPALPDEIKFRLEDNIKDPAVDYIRDRMILLNKRQKTVLTGHKNKHCIVKFSQKNTAVIGNDYSIDGKKLYWDSSTGEQILERNPYSTEKSLFPHTNLQFIIDDDKKSIVIVNKKDQAIKVFLTENPICSMAINYDETKIAIATNPSCTNPASIILFNLLTQNNIEILNLFESFDFMQSYLLYQLSFIRTANCFALLRKIDPDNKLFFDENTEKALQKYLSQ